MRKPNSKAVRITALATAAAFALLPMATAAAATVNSSAFGIQATNVLGIVNVAALPTSTCPPEPGAHNSALGANLGALGTVGAVNANTDCDATAGTSSARGSAANVALLPNVALPGLAAITAAVVQADCSANGTTVTGSSTLTTATLGTAAIAVNPAPNDVLLNLPNIAVLTLNEQIVHNDGSLTVNALHLVLGPNGSLGDIIIGSATCGPNTPVAGVAAFSFQDLPLILGALALIVVIGFGIRTGIRRLGSAA
jgi:hypothetical protein